MLTIDAVLEKFRSDPTPSVPDSPFRHASSLASPATVGEIEASWPTHLPDEMRGLWLAARSAQLLTDMDYGQWGLVLLDPYSSRARTDAERVSRPNEFRNDDIVVGEFLGDQELLVFSPSEHGARRVVIALPLDERGEWPSAAASLAEFLEKYFAASGAKYWEPRHAPHAG